MGTARKLAAALAGVALLSVVGVNAASAQEKDRCDKAAAVTEKIEQKKAKVAERRARFDARQEKHSRPADWVMKHEAKFDAAIVRIEAKATKALGACPT